MKLKKLMLIHNLLMVIAFTCSNLVVAAATVDETIFPLRSTYSSVATISHQKLIDKINDTLIIDVRSAYEFSVLHINNAVNVPITNLGFIPTLEILRANDTRPIVFYCNGITCRKSYKASIMAQENGIENVRTFDLGMLNWAKLYPEKSAFFNLSPLNKNHLITPEKFRQHLLLPRDFISKITPDNLVLDIREPFQRDELILKKNSTSTPLNKFHYSLKLIKENKSTVLIYDAVGKQVRWLQYLLEKHNIENYYFMQGGVKGYIAAGLDKTTIVKDLSLE